MALDALAGVALRFVGEVVLVNIFYWPGWIFLRVLTAGRYPPVKVKYHSKEFVAVCGLCAAIACMLVACTDGGSEVQNKTHE